MACWKGVPEAKVRYCLTARTESRSRAGPSAQPIFQPVAEKVFPALEMRIVLSFIPGRQESGTWVPSKTRCSYTSSATATRSRSMQSLAMTSSSAAREHPAARIVGRVDDDEPGGRGDRLLELPGVEGPLGRPERHDPAPGARQLDRRRIGVVVRLEDDDLVAFPAEGHDGGGDGLRRAGGHEDLRQRVEVELPPARLVLGDRLEQRRHSPSGRVLVLPVADCLDRRREDLGRPVGVGEALTEVDRPVGECEGRHLAEDAQAVGIEASGSSGPGERRLFSSALLPLSGAGVVVGCHEQAR